MPKSPKKPTLDLLLSEIEKLKKEVLELKEQRDLILDSLDELDTWTMVSHKDSRYVRQRLVNLEHKVGLRPKSNKEHPGRHAMKAKILEADRLSETAS